MSRHAILHAQVKSLLLQHESLPDTLVLRGSPGMSAVIETDDMDSSTVALLRDRIANGDWITLEAELPEDDDDE